MTWRRLSDQQIFDFRKSDIQLEILRHNLCRGILCVCNCCCGHCGTRASDNPSNDEKIRWQNLRHCICDFLDTTFLDSFCWMGWVFSPLKDYLLCQSSDRTRFNISTRHKDFSLKCMHWIWISGVANHVAVYKSMWGTFQVRYYRVTGNSLQFPRLKILILIISTGCLLCAILFLLALNALLEGEC